MIALLILDWGSILAFVLCIGNIAKAMDTIEQITAWSDSEKADVYNLRRSFS